MPINRQMVDEDTKLKATEKWLYETQEHLDVMTEEKIMRNLTSCYKCLKLTQERIKFLMRQRENLKPNKLNSETYQIYYTKESDLLKSEKKEEVTKKWIESQKVLSANPSKAIKSSYQMKYKEKRRENVPIENKELNNKKIKPSKVNLSNRASFLLKITKTNSKNDLKKLSSVDVKTSNKSYVKIIATNKPKVVNRTSETRNKTETQESLTDVPCPSNLCSQVDYLNCSSNSIGLYQVDESQTKLGTFTTALLLKSTDKLKSSNESFAFSPTFRCGTEPQYCVCGANGGHIIEKILKSYGWMKTKDKNDSNFKLKWCELKSSIDFASFREGEQMANHIPNSEALTNKYNLIRCINEYAKIQLANHKTVKLDFMPESYGLDDPKEKKMFLSVFKESEIWICKPTKLNQGKGIFLIRRQEDLKKAISSEQIHNPSRFKPLNRIVQRYISNPLLIENRKFDIRCYMLIATTLPFLVLYHQGYVRLSIHEYDKNSNNMITHLTNQYIQKKDPRYTEKKENTIWSMEKFNEYFNQNLATKYKLTQDWVLESLTKKMQTITMSCFNTAKNKLERKLGFFELFGLDFLIDNDLKVWMIEINSNPSMATNCSVLKELAPSLLKETLDISIECFEKGRRKKTFMPLVNLKNFEVLHSPCLSQAPVIGNKSVSQGSNKKQQQNLKSTISLGRYSTNSRFEKSSQI